MISGVGSTVRPGALGYRKSTLREAQLPRLRHETPEGAHRGFGGRQAVDVPGSDQVETTTVDMVIFWQFRDFVFATGQ